jgi:hypothetical protein
MALLGLAASQAGASHRHDVPVTGVYVNRDYGFSVAVPAAHPAWQNAAPAPNHGVEIDLGPGRMLSVTAEFNAIGYTSLDALLGGELETGARRRVMHTRLAGAPALRGEVSKGQGKEVVVVRQDGRDVDAINFVVDLNTTEKAQRADEQILTEVIASFRTVAR